MSKTGSLLFLPAWNGLARRRLGHLGHFSRGMLFAGLAAFLSVDATFARDMAPAAVSSEAEGPGASALAAKLAADVGAIANSTALSRAKKEKRIASTVRVAVVVATTYKKDPAEILGLALTLGEAAARAAPSFAEAIASSVSFAPPVAHIDAAAGQVRTAVFAAAKAPRAVRRTRPMPELPEPAAEPEPPEPAPVRRTRTPPAELAEVPAAAPTPRQTADYTAADVLAELNAIPPAPSGPNISLGDNVSLVVTADLAARHDDNLYLSSTNKVSDTITSVTPGAELRFGQRSLAHGSLIYRSAFTHYTRNTSPNVTLGSGTADFGYDNGSIILDGFGSYQQLNQNTSATAGLGGSTVYRQTSSVLGGNIERVTSAKTSVRAGAAVNRTDYASGGLMGTDDVSVPLTFFYKTTPKLDLSIGYTYTKVTPQQEGNPTSKDSYYNVGLRGDITPKLSGNFSVGYRTREVALNPQERLIGFDGSFNYEVSAKSGLVLSLSRNFSAGVQGESLKSDSYGLRFNTEPNSQLQFTAGLSYRRDAYGLPVFDPSRPASLLMREDSYWQTDLAVTYLFNSWLSMSLDGTFRRNHSTIPGVEFSDNILGVSMGLRY